MKLSDYPELLKQWHPTKNGNLKPEGFTSGSQKKVWWKCPVAEDHEWETSISHRKNGTDCPFCAGRMASLSNCLSTTHPEIVKQWHPTKNGNLRPEDFTAGSHKKIWWKCPVADDHEWETSINHRKNGTGCPFCAGTVTVASNCLSTTHPEIAKQWHPTKNGNLRPEDFTHGSRKKIWWKCSIAKDHEWKAAIKHRTHGTNCSCCAGMVVVLSNCLSTTHPEIAKQWHPTKNGNLRPEDFTAGSHKKIWWKCPAAEDHEWEAIISNVTKGKRIGCSCCAGKKVVTSNCLLTTHPEIAKQWHSTKNGNLRPEDFTAGSHKKIWWKCPVANDHVWKSIIKNRTMHGNGCPICNESKGEFIISRTLFDNKISFEREYKFDSCKNKRTLPFDFVVWHNDKLMAIEYQGYQHYHPIQYFGGEFRHLYTVKNDAIKRNWCKLNNIPLLGF